MISLNVYLTPKAGREQDLEVAIRDGWIRAMSEQPGFLRAATIKPFPDDELAKVGAITPQSAYEVVAYWRSESERAAWVQRPVHDEVFARVVEACESVSYTLYTVEQSWNL